MKKNDVYLICLSIIISSIIIGMFIRSGFEAIGQYLDNGLRLINQTLPQLK
ncbi:hypothetical protein [Streptococcus marimammalium]|uniref:hypothetical protein n=1 Tax=Streptococcus marimammalium TaxID=269666 RepID=UPI00037FD0DE|nr:hypothetical protein [Streptococcus marimammalium]